MTMTSFCNFPDLMLIKRFCEDILKTIDMLNVGNCSLKGFVCCKLLEVYKQLKQFHGSVQYDQV